MLTHSLVHFCAILLVSLVRPVCSAWILNTSMRIPREGNHTGPPQKLATTIAVADTQTTTYFYPERWYMVKGQWSWSSLYLNHNSSPYCVTLVQLSNLSDPRFSQVSGGTDNTYLLGLF